MHIEQTLDLSRPRQVCRATWAVHATAAMIVAGLLSIEAGFADGAVRYQATLLHPPGYYSSWANGAADGTQVGYALEDTPGQDPHAVLWSADAVGAIDLNPVGFSISAAAGVWDEKQVGGGLGPVTAGLMHALMWEGTAASAVDLHPAGFVRSQALGISDTGQVGWGFTTPFGNESRALLWNGTAASAIDLHPAGFASSRAFGVSGATQVGDGIPIGSGNTGWQALLWNGSAASVVDLHPAGFENSGINDVSGESQVGWAGYYDPGFGDVYHAQLWKGTATSVVDLHPAGFDVSFALGVWGDTQVGYARIGFGQANYETSRALAWKGTAESVVDLHAFLADLEMDFTWSEAFDIAEDGTIVGVATADREYAVLWTPVTEPMLPGDTNGDGLINIDDLNNVRNYFGTGDGTDLSGIPGDAYPFDGFVNVDDLNAVRNHFGAASAAVPEPAPLVLIVSGLFAVAIRGMTRPSHQANQPDHINSRHLPNPDMSFPGDDKPASDCAGVLIEHGLQNPNSIRRAFVAQPQKNDSRVAERIPKKQFAKVLVVSHDDAGLRDGSGQDARIVGLRHCLGYRDDIVSRAAQVIHNRCTGGFVDEKAHGGVLVGNGDREDIFPGKHVGRVSQSRPDVVRLKTRVFAQNLCFGNPLGDQSNHQFHGDSRAANDRFSDHDFRVYNDAFRKGAAHG